MKAIYEDKPVVKTGRDRMNPLQKVPHGRIPRLAKGVLVISILLMLPAVGYPFGKNKVHREQITWRVMRSLHFDVHYPEGIDELGARTLVFAEEAYQSIGNSLSYETGKVIPIIVYPSAIDFQENTVNDEILGEGIGGFTETLKGRVVIPFNGDYAEYRHVLSHEIVHAICFDMLGMSSGGVSFMSISGPPIWIFEGLAEYLSIGYDESADTVMRDIIYNEQYASLPDLTRGYVRSEYLYYKEGQAFFYFFEKQYGKDAIARLMRIIRDTGDFAGALKALTGKTSEKLGEEWIHYFKLIYYPASKGKRFDQDLGIRYTNHPDDYSSYNSSPAVNPDGTKIAYLSNEGLYAHISVMTLGKKKAKEIRTIVHGETNSRFEGMHLLDNNLTWSSDGKLLFCAQSYGRDTLFIVNPDSGEVIDQYVPPFRSVRNPSISRDGTRIVFVGQSDLSCDVYLFDIQTRHLSRVTSDRFVERDPIFDATGSSIIYATNENAGQRFDATTLNIVRRYPAKGNAEVLVSNGGRNMHPEISPDGKTLVYTSDRTGIFNIYTLNIAAKKEERMSDVLCGLYAPKFFPDGKKIAFVSYQNLGYDIGVRELPLQEGIDSSRKNETIREERSYGPSYTGVSSFDSRSYEPSLRNDYLTAMGAGVVGSGGLALMGMIQGAYSDMLGERRLVGTVEYYGYDRKNGANADISYWYLPNRTDIGLGIFTQRSPYGIISMDTINELIHNIYDDTESVYHYGAYGVVSYPFTRFVRFDLSLTSSRYEWEYSNRSDVYANINKAGGAFSYDTTIWSFMGPIDGTRAMVQAENAFNITRQDYSYRSVNIDVRRYFFFFDYYTFAFRFAGGRIFGRDRGSFDYSLGGFDTLRGYSFDEVRGDRMFLASAEFRFIIVEGVKFGFPLFFGLGGIGGVLFVDSGSSWNGAYHFKKKDGTFDDFKCDTGFGFRMALVPAVSLKLDFAWPYNNKSFGGKKVYFSIGIDY